jgi:hypothetical protein
VAAKVFSVSSPTAAPRGPGGVRAARGRSTGGAGAAGRSPGRLCALRCAAHDEHIREYLTREAAGTMGTKEAPVQLQELALPQAVRARTDAERANAPPRQRQATCLARANRCSSALPTKRRCRVRACCPAPTRYCECFASGEYCDNCNCQSCCNNIENAAERNAAIEATLERNPAAFRPKIAQSPQKVGLHPVRL